MPQLADGRSRVLTDEQRAPFAQDAVHLQVAQLFGDVELWVSAKSFADVFYVMSKVVDPAQVQHMFLESFAFIKVCSTSGEDVEEAARRGWGGFEDCLVAIAAEKVKAGYIITRNVEGFKHAKVPARAPVAFFDMMREEKGLVYEELI